MTIRRIRLAAFFGFLLLVAASVTVTFWALRAQQADALVINLAGRQRMLTQKMTLQVLGVQIGASPAYREQLRITEYVYFERTLHALIAGGEVPYTDDTTVTLPPTRDPEILTQLEIVRATWGEMDLAIHTVLEEDPASAAFAEAVATVERLSPEFLAQMDRAVRMYEAEAARKVARVQVIQIGFLAAAMTLLAVAFFLTEHWVLAPIDLLRAAARRIGEGDLETPVSVTGPGEIDQLARSFDDMRQSLTASRAELEAWAQQLGERVRQRTGQLSALHEVTALIGASPDLEQMLAAAVDKASEVMQVESAGVLLFDPVSEELRLTAYRGLSERFVREIGRIKLGAELSGRVAATGEPIVLSNIAEDPRLTRSVVREEGWRAFASVPLLSRGQVLGVLNVGSRQEERTFPTDEVALLSAIGRLLGTAIENVRLYETERQQTAELTRSNVLIAALGRVAAQIETTLDPDQVLETLGAELKRLDVTCFVALLEPDGQALVIHYDSVESDALALAEKLTGLKMRSFHLPRQRFPLWDELVEHGRAVFAPDSTRLAVTLMPGFPRAVVERALRLVGLTPEVRAIYLPMTVEERVLGMLAMWGEDLQEDDLPAASIFATQVAAALEVARLHEQVKARRIEEQAGLYRLSLDLAGVVNPEEVCRRVTATAAAALRAGRCLLAEFDRGARQVIGLAPAHGLPDEIAAAICYTVDDEIIAMWDIGHEPHLIVNDTGALPASLRDLAERADVHSLLAARMVVDDQPIGILFTADREDGPFDEDDARLLAAYAQQAALALERARLYAHAHERLERISALHDIDVAITSRLHLQETLDILLEKVTERLQVDAVAVALIHPETRELRYAARRGLNEEFFVDGLLKVKEGIAGQVAHSGQPMAIPDMRAEPRFVRRSIAERLSLVSYLAVPLRARGEIIGVLEFATHQPHTFSSEEVDFFVTLAGQAAIVIDNTRMFEAEAQRAAELEAVRQASLSLTSRLALEEVLDAVLEGALRLISEADNAHFFLYQAGRLVFGTALWADGRRGQPVAEPRSDGLTYTVARQGQPIIVPDMRAHPLYADAPPEWKGAIVGLPLEIGQRVVGVMNVSSSEPHAFTEAELRVLRLLGDQAAIAIENARLFEETARQRDRLQLLHRLDQAISGTLALPELLDQLAGGLTAALGVNRCSIWLLDERGEFLRGQGYSIQPGEPDIESIRLPRSEPVAARLLETRQPLVVPDVNDPTYADMVNREYVAAFHIQSFLAAPLVWQDQATGFLVLDDTRGPHTFHPEDIQLVESVAAQAAIAIENARLFETTRRSAEELKAASEVLRGLNATPDVNEAFPAVVASLRDITNCERVSLALLDERRESVTFVALDQPRAELSHGTQLRVSDTSAAADVLAGRPHLTPDLSAEVDFPAEQALYQAGYRSRINLPLRVGEQIIGALNLTWPHEAGYDEELLPLLRQIADAVALAVERSRLFDETHRRAEELGALAEVSSALRVALIRAEMLPIILDQLLTVLHVKGAALAMRDPTSEETVIELGRGDWATWTGVRLQPGEGVSGHVIAAGQPYVNDDVRADPRAARLDLHGDLRAAACVPLIAQEQTIGALWVGRETAITKHEVRLLTAVAEMAGNALHRAGLHEQLEEAYMQTVLALARAMDTRDTYTSDHSQRLTVWAEAVARELGCDAQEVEAIAWGALLHDIGKIGVPDEILRKRGDLTEEEWTVMQRHPELGAEIVEPVKKLAQVAPIIRAHQEKYDGSGYPEGLRGEEIPMGARILAVVDAYGAITDERVYRKARGHAEAVAELRRCAGTHFDPQVVAAFLKVISEQWTVNSDD